MRTTFSCAFDVARSFRLSARGLRSCAAVTSIVAALGAAAGCDPVPLNAEIGRPGYFYDVPAPIDDANDLVAYVAQCEAVLGPVPEISCDPANPAPGTHVTQIPVLFNGLPLGFGDDETDAEILEERRAAGEYSCDFPSLAGDFPCSVGSTLVQYQAEDNPNVQWVGLCRGVGYDNLGYDRFIGSGLIGANVKTGEMCFFFGTNPTPDDPYVLPQLRSDVGDARELAPWLPPREMPGSCLSCHPNNDPWVMTPWLQPDYMLPVLQNPDYPLTLPDGVVVEDLLAARFIEPTPIRLRTLLPRPLPEARTAWAEEEIIDAAGEVLLRQYRAVGSSYVANEAAGLVAPRVGSKPADWNISFRDRLLLDPPESSCSAGCHASASANFGMLARDALGIQNVNMYRTELMDSAAIPGSHWMPPGPGPVEPWRGVFEASVPSIPAISECPLPKRVNEPPVVTVDCSADDAGVVSVRWHYATDFGNVPGRDDVRFDVAIAIGEDAHAARGISMTSSVEGIKFEAAEPDVEIIRDVAPDDAFGGYSIELPFSLGQRDWVIDLQPKRLCFEEPDRRPYAYATPHRLVVDVAASCGR